MTTWGLPCQTGQVSCCWWTNHWYCVYTYIYILHIYLYIRVYIYIQKYLCTLMKDRCMFFLTVPFPNPRLIIIFMNVPFWCQTKQSCINSYLSYDIRIKSTRDRDAAYRMGMRGDDYPLTTYPYILKKNNHQIKRQKTIWYPYLCSYKIHVLLRWGLYIPCRRVRRAAPCNARIPNMSDPTGLM